MDNRQPMSSRSVNISPQKSPKKRIASKQLDPNPTSSTQPSSSAPSTRPTRINEEESAAAWDAELAQLYKDMETMPKKEALKKLGVSGKFEMSQHFLESEYGY